MTIDSNNRNNKNKKKNNESNLLMILIALSISLTFAATIRVVSSFVPIQLQHRIQSPLLSLPLSSETMITRKRTRTTKLFQSAISSPVDYSSLKIPNLRQEERKGPRGSSSSSCCCCPSPSSSISLVRQVDANTCPAPQPSITTNDYDTAFFPDPSLILPDTPTKEEKVAILRSMSIIELKLACSRRNIQYGKFPSSSKNSKKVYIEAISKDMEYTITGLIRPGTMIELTGEELDEEIANCQYYSETQDNVNDDGLILVDVFATWCGPCRASVPFLEEAAKRLVNDKVRGVKIDSDKENEWTSRYQVQGLPTLLLLQNGEILDRLEGSYATNEIVSFVQRHTTQRTIFVK
mmetsp:Transcript_21732/g.24246  ORF Transcript_21732/g.24246 Transcript_21732/m.24246 type:complete len:350 (-) Transcript_21732:190-1239(-)